MSRYLRKAFLVSDSSGGLEYAVRITMPSTLVRMSMPSPEPTVHIGDDAAIRKILESSKIEFRDVKD